MLDQRRRFSSIQWRNLASTDRGHSKPKLWDQRWQSAVLYPAKTCTTYQYRAHLICKIRSEFEDFVIDLLTKLKCDSQSWISANNVLTFDDVELRRISPGTELNQWKSRLKSYELIDMIQKDGDGQDHLHTPLCIIVNSSHSLPVVAMAKVDNLQSGFMMTATILPGRIECQRHAITGRLYFIGDEDHNELMIRISDDVYIRSELILHLALTKLSTNQTLLDSIIRKRLKTIAKALNRLDLDGKGQDLISRGQQITDCLHQQGSIFIVFLPNHVVIADCYIGMNCRLLGQIISVVKLVSIRLHIFKELICRSVKFLVRRWVANNESCLDLETGLLCMNTISIVLRDRYHYLISQQESQIMTSFINTTRMQAFLIITFIF